jgi:hypothetical protein
LQVLKPYAGKDKFVDTLFGIYPAMHHFNFGSIDPVPDQEWVGLQLYSFDLLENDLFDVPYEAFSFGWSQTLQGQRVDRIVACLKLPGDVAGKPEMPVAGLECWMFNSVQHQGQLGYHCMHTLFSAINSKKAGKLMVLEPEVLPIRENGARLKADKDECTLAPSLVSDMTALVALLHADGVSLRSKPAPQRLNKMRVAKGKFPIGPMSDVFINVGGTQYATSGAIVGSHASPRMHWRRGHVRRLQDGKITNVKPCLVGSVGSAAPREYRVKVA